MSRRRRHRQRGAAVGADVVPADVQRAIDLFTDRLIRNDAAPVDVVYSVDPQTRYRYVTFSFYTPFRADRASEMLPSSYKVGPMMLYVKTRVLAEAEVGTEALPAHARAKAAELATALAAQDAAPAGWRWDADTLYALFYTPFRRERAIALLPPSYTADGRTIYIGTDLVHDVQLGQVVGADQSTPWTCGPASLRAVLLHHGIDVTEDDVAVRAGNVPVLGVRPSGLVKAAQELGCYVSAVVLRDVDALAPFLARDLPVLLVVDSWTQPGKAGHWVVATALEGDQVRLMDPHTPGNWRVLPKVELDRKWWHRERGRVVRRFAIVVAPQVRVALGAEAPAHGRTAHVPGPSKALVVFAKVAQAIGKAVVTFFTGSAGGKAYDALLNMTGTNVAKMHAGEKAKWFNDAGNPEIYVWALSLARDKVREWSTPPDAKANKEASAVRAITRALGITLVSFDDIRKAMIPALKFHLTAYCRNGTAMSAHAIQAILILFYGGLAETWALVKAARKARPKFDWDKPDAAAIAGWTDQVVEALEPHRTVAEGADNPDLEFA